MRKISFSDEYMPITVKYWTGDIFETVYDMDFHKKPGKVLKSLVRDYVHELRVDDYNYRSYSIKFGQNTYLHIWGFNNRGYKSVTVMVSRKTGYSYFKDGATYEHTYLLNETIKC